MRTHCIKCCEVLDITRIFRQSYCKKCHAEYSRLNRRRHCELTPESKKRANARSYANRYIKYGILKKEPCSNCGDEKAEMHHEDYDKPLQVKWLCRPCHLQHHNVIRGTLLKQTQNHETNI